MTVRHYRARRGFTQIDVMVGAVILVIAVLGTSVYQYQAALNARKADVHATALRTASLLCVGWTGVDDTVSFDPVSVFGADMNISAGAGPEAPTGFTTLGSYTILIDGFYYFATLSYKDVNTKVKALNVVISWDRCNHGTNELAKANADYRLTTYVQKPG